MPTTGKALALLHAVALLGASTLASACTSTRASVVVQPPIGGEGAVALDAGEVAIVLDAGEDAAVPTAGEPEGADAASGRVEGGRGGRVAGVVVAPNTAERLAGRTVWIGGQSATTQADGRFVIEGAPASYDAFVVDANGRLVTVHYGLTRRDPVLRHNCLACYGGRRAQISGRLEGAFPFPLPRDYFVLFFFVGDERVRVLSQIEESVPTEFGPFGIDWRGPGPARGEIVALGFGVDATRKAFLSPALASRGLTVADGEKAVVDLALAPVPLRRLAGSVEVPESGYLDGLSFSYQVQNRVIRPGLWSFSRAANPFDYQVPDLSSIGATICLTASGTGGTVFATRCGIRGGTVDRPLRLLAPPQVLRPATNSPITQDTKLAWGTVEDGVYILGLSPDGSGPAPEIVVHTQSSELRWPDLSSIGIPYYPGVKYTCRLETRVPFRTMDDYAQGEAVHAALVETQLLFSDGFSVTTIR